jgi:hypothetical protein
MQQLPRLLLFSRLCNDIICFEIITDIVKPLVLVCSSLNCQLVDNDVSAIELQDLLPMFISSLNLDTEVYRVNLHDLRNSPVFTLSVQVSHTVV